MPTSNEIVQQKGLNGDELKRIMVKDFEDMLSRDAMFMKHMEYPRAAYRIRFQLFTQIAMYPEHANQVQSAPPAKGRATDRSGGREAITSVSDIKKYADETLENIEVGKQRERVIDSPNLARIENNLPITIQQRMPEKEGFVDVEVHYDAEAEKGQHPDLNQATDSDVENWDL